MGNDGWGPEAAQALCEQVKDLEISLGGRLEDLFAVTKNISKVMLEKLFETWHHERVVLMGDDPSLCRPSAVNAMEDAVILANALKEIREPTLKKITAAFEDHRSQRDPHAQTQFQASKMFAMLMVGQRRNNAKTLNYCPQATFLPEAPAKCIISILPNRPSKKYAELVAREGQLSIVL
ncbi:hypothetical protein CPB97_010906 [Podila verticillata]|nr:hypothetical protein CPB97_010906 [Podila verticillata]